MIVPLVAQLPVGNLHKVLVVALTQVHVMLPVRVVSYHDFADAIRKTVIHEISCRLHQVMVHWIVAVHRDSRHLLRSR
ncbi:MAG: hypothetical protein C7B45_16120 [Sulfobacillus acidophilus]|uniref:Uncharacterized protein n=1 Tax=Sulfobacillus acidophilus TaxID=53633 RepID=A0A2T2WD78_9FIRM|nr:MAG: hypothetical protein C7B45_16120 [Sulfobacillus acidophilus]